MHSPLRAWGNQIINNGGYVIPPSQPSQQHHCTYVRPTISLPTPGADLYPDTKFWSNHKYNCPTFPSSQCCHGCPIQYPYPAIDQHATDAATADNRVQNLGMGDFTTCVYQFIYNENYNYETKIIQYLIMHKLGLCIKVDSYVVKMFYAWSFSNNTALLISIMKNKCFISLNTRTTVFVWGAGKLNKNRT